MFLPLKPLTHNKFKPINKELYFYSLRSSHFKLTTGWHNTTNQSQLTNYLIDLLLQFALCTINWHKDETLPIGWDVSALHTKRLWMDLSWTKKKPREISQTPTHLNIQQRENKKLLAFKVWNMYVKQTHKVL